MGTKRALEILKRAAIPITVVLAAGYLLLALVVAMPGKSGLKSDRLLMIPPEVGIAAGGIALVAFVLGLALALKRHTVMKGGQTPPSRLNRAIRLCFGACIGGMLLLTTVYMVKTISTAGDALRHFWTGQTMGILGLFMIIGIRVLWRMRNRSES